MRRNRGMRTVWAGVAVLMLWAATALAAEQGKMRTVVQAGHGGAVVGLAFSPDGRHLASVGLDGFLKIWDVGGRCLVNSICLAPQPDERAARIDRIAWRADKAVAVLSATEQRYYRMDGRAPFDETGLSGFALSRNGATAAWVEGLGGRPTVHVLDTVGSASLTAPDLPFDDPNLVISPDGRHIAVCGHSGSSARLLVWEARSGEVTFCISRSATVFGENGRFIPLALAPGGKHIAGLLRRPSDGEEQASEHHDFVVIDLGGVTPPFRLIDTGRVSPWTQASFSPDGRHLGFQPTLLDPPRFWDMANLSEPERLAPEAFGYSSFAFSPDGSVALGQGGDTGNSGLFSTCRIAIAQRPDQALTWLGKERLEIRHVAISPDNTRLAVMLEGLGTSPEGQPGGGSAIAVFDIRDMHPLWSSREVNGFKPREVAFAPDGKTIWAKDQEYLVRIDASTGKVLSRLDLGGPGSNAGTFGLDIDTQGMVAVVLPSLDRETGQEMIAFVRQDGASTFRTITHPGPSSGQLRISPDGRLVALLHAKGIAVLRAEDGKRVAYIAAQDDSASAQATPDGKTEPAVFGFSPDGRHIRYGNALWRTNDGGLVYRAGSGTAPPTDFDKVMAAHGPALALSRDGALTVGYIPCREGVIITKPNLKATVHFFPDATVTIVGDGRVMEIGEWQNYVYRVRDSQCHPAPPNSSINWAWGD